jgi:cytochrome c556
MSKFRFVACLSILAAVAAPVFAQTAELTPQQIVAARQASLELSSATFAAMLKAAADGADAKTSSQPAHALAMWAKVLPTLFPAGTGAGQTPLETKAKPEIWSDRAGFEKAAANYLAAATTLSSLAEADDTAGFKSQLDDVKKACIACHKAYKGR